MYSSTPIVSSKKRELPSPELLDEPKKNKLADSSVESVDIETSKFSYSEQLPMADVVCILNISDYRLPMILLNSLNPCRTPQRWCPTRI